jgi:hypothetical protein
MRSVDKANRIRISKSKNDSPFSTDPKRIISGQASAEWFRMKKRGEGFIGKIVE